MYCTCQRNQSITPTVAGATRLVFKADNVKNFEFISAESSKDRATRSKIRSHVMKRVKDIHALEQSPSTVTLQQQGAWRVHESAPAYQSTRLQMSFASKPRSVCPRCGGATKGQSQMWIMEQTCQIQSALQGLPVNCIEGSTLLFQYLRDVYSYILNFSWERGQNLKTNCLPYMVSGPAVLNSVLSVMAVNRMLISGPSPHLMAVFYHHKIEAIRMIRKSLKDTSDPVSISGDTLVAIATLSILENSTGFMATGRRHLDALDGLIQTRSHSAQLATNIFQTGLINLARFAGRNFPLTPCAIQGSPMSDLLSRIPQDAHSTLTTMFHELKCLSLDMTPSSEVMSKTEWLQRLNALGLSMHRTMAGGFFQTGVENVPLRAYTIVGYIFLCLFLRELPLSSPIFDYLLECLSHALNEENMIKDIKWYPDRFLLWLLFVGGASAAGRTQRGWFKAQIPAVQARLNLKTQDETLAVLYGFPFVGACYAPFQELWKETESALNPRLYPGQYWQPGSWVRDNV